MRFKTQLLTALICFPFLSGVSTSQSPSAPTWSFLEDADQDGMTDVDEILLSLDPLDPADGLSDLDGDGLSLAWEFSIGTHSSVADTDADGWSDSEEYLLYGTDPINWMSFPLTSGSPTGAAPAPASSPAAAPAPPPPPPPAPSLDNGEFSVVNFTTWNNALGSTSYQNGGFKWGAGLIGGWTAYVGSTVEVWEVGSERFIELDGSAGNYGVKQPIANVRAGGYVLTWKQCGRTHSNAGSDPYKVKVYYMNGTSEVVLTLSPLYAGFSKTAWSNNALSFQISPEQLTAAGTSPIYVAYVPLGSMNTYGTLIDKVAIIPVDIQEVVSDQISGNEANRVPTPFYIGAPNNPMLMATRTGTSGHLALKVDVPSAHSSAVRVGIRVVGTTTILASVPTVPLPAKTLLPFTTQNGAKMYEVVAGHDSDGNGVLDPGEAFMVFEKTPKTDSSGTPATAGLGNLDKIIVATESDFVNGKIDCITNNIWGTDYTGDLISAFAHGTTTADEATTTSPHVITANSSGLSHQVGARWDSAFNAETHKVSWYDGSEASDDVKSSYALPQVLRDAILLNLAAIKLATPLGGAWGNSGSYSFSISRNLAVTEDEWVGINELGYAFGKINFTGTMIVNSRWVAGGKIEVGTVSYSGQFEDTYDFSYWGGAKARQASFVQAGHATLINPSEPESGKVFFTKVVFNGDKDIDEEF